MWTDATRFFSKETPHLLCGAPEGVDAIFLAQVLKEGTSCLHVARDDVRLETLAALIAFFAPDIECRLFPAWDTVPYDRVSPHVSVMEKRLDTLTFLTSAEAKEKPVLVLTTVNALLQRVPPKTFLSGAVLPLKTGSTIALEKLLSFLERYGYGRTGQVMEPGEYAVRGGIVDLFTPGQDLPVRLDFFGDELDTIRSFDPISQKTQETLKRIDLKPVGEVFLDKSSISHFRQQYRALFGTPSDSDALYSSISEGKRFSGMEQWLPLFHRSLDTLFDYCPDFKLSFDPQYREAITSRCDQVMEYFTARQHSLEQKLSLEEGGGYNPVTPDSFYLDEEAFNAFLEKHDSLSFSPFKEPPSDSVTDLGGRGAAGYADSRVKGDAALYQAVTDDLKSAYKEKDVCLLAGRSDQSLGRVVHILSEHGLPSFKETSALPSLPKKASYLKTILPILHGFSLPGLYVVTERDILGDRLSRPVSKKRKAEHFIADVSALSEGDLVVHDAHGIGRYEGLITIDAGGAPHDCLQVTYADGDKLFVPVENIDSLSRYGSDHAGANLDRLGGSAWQARKAKLKKKIRDIADQLIKTAAARTMKKAGSLLPPAGGFDEFCARFPFTETEDQLSAIQDVTEDLAAGRPMDRLVCGDVGFGKTEVALRAAFVAALNGEQVAVVVPTTLLARQHYKNFAKRFAGFPVRIEQLSRLVSQKNMTLAKRGVADGTVDIVIGTHALLAKTINFARLGLLIIDEEQHFGVTHKERLKEMKSDIHVLTLTATPIPRTLQLSLSGVRSLSLIATPPVDRLAVRTFVLPFDPVVVRESLMRERFRGGQSFVVCPRISDLEEMRDRLGKLVPELSIAVAHGQMKPNDLDDVMTRFADGVYDILLATNIIESGIDMPTVNTLIVHRSDRFGLAQLYQIRGRIGRGKVRAYAYLTVPPNRKLTANAQKRLDVLQTLDTLGAGFSLASHDMDIRGAGNLLGEEQSGHVREVGVELYQHMLEEAVAAAKSGDMEEADLDWSPQISLGMPVMIPEKYVGDLGVRLGLYRRLGDLRTEEEVTVFGEELKDRFGELPDEVDNLLSVIMLKALCRQAHVEKIDAGPRGAVLHFRSDRFPNPAGLIQFITAQMGTVSLRPDHKLVCKRQWDNASQRLVGVRRLMTALAEIATEKEGT